MKKGIKGNMGKLIVALIVTAAILGWYSWSHVTGGEIQGAADIATAEKVTVEKKDSANSANDQTYTLTDAQKEKLCKLVSQGTYKLAGVTVTVDSSEYYVITADFGSSREPLVITSLGSEYIQVKDQFSGKHLKILNYNWQDQLNEILSGSAA
jgi:hypothetical protein